jgi:radical SAM protein with 4Fe4S-binding SPASM domain
VDPAGNVFLTAYSDDERFRLGNSRNCRLQDLWYSEKTRNIFREVPQHAKTPCSGRSWYAICGGGSLMLRYQVHGSFDLPDDWCGPKKQFLRKLREAMT